MKQIAVTCALIGMNGKILVCRRGIKSDHPLKWEFPGGKIEAGEAASACIKREIYEELGVDFQPQKQLKAVEYEYPTKSISLIPFIGIIASGKPVPVEHEEIKWIKTNEIETFDLSEADKELYKLNKTEIECWLY